MLPNLPSELITIALADLALVEAAPRYRVNMGESHAPGLECSVCFSKALMAKTGR